MTTPIRLLAAAVAAIGFAASASAQYPGHHPVVEQTTVIVQQQVFPPPIPVYCYDTFARDFRPCPGKHHIAIIHPVTKCPVEVCFCLPDRKLKEIEVNRREIEFDYVGFKKVELEFKRDGTVKVIGG
jgi:hypothetical protein